MDNADALAGNVSMPPNFDNRRADNWRLLFSIAGLCSGAEEWGDKARAAAVKIEGASDTTSVSVRLLIHVKKIFDEDKCAAILSATLVTRLKADPEAPWDEWNRGKGLTQNSLARLLSRVHVRSGDVHLPGDRVGHNTLRAPRRAVVRFRNNPVSGRKASAFVARKGRVARHAARLLF